MWLGFCFSKIRDSSLYLSMVLRILIDPASHCSLVSTAVKGVGSIWHFFRFHGDRFSRVKSEREQGLETPVQTPCKKNAEEVWYIFQLPVFVKIGTLILSGAWIFF